MKPILFEKDATTFDGFGLYRLIDAISCTVTEERNGEYELQLVYPITGQYFGEITEDRIIVAIPHSGGSRQAFRIYRREAELAGEVTFLARHISYELNFVPIDLVSGSTTDAEVMMNTLAGAALGTVNFSFWSDVTTLVPVPFSVAVPCGFRAALGGQEGSVLDKFGGEFEWDNWTVKLHEERGADNGVKIVYGKNLTELEQTLDIGDTITGVMAFYQYEDENGNTQTVYSSPKVISSANPNPYAYPRILALDITDQFDSVPTALDVTAYAAAYVSRSTSVDPVEVIDISFVPLGQTAEYEYLKELETVRLCDTITVSYKRLGVTVKKKVTRCVWNVLLDRYDEISLGEEQTLADTIAKLESSEINSKGSSGSVNLLDVYPIGSFYLSLSSVPPDVLFGGEWDQVKGRFLIGTGENDENSTDYWGSMAAATINCPPTERGGEAWHKLTAAESGVPAHTHPVRSKTLQGYQSGSNRTGYNATGSGASNFDPGCQNNAAQDAANAHNNMPPYLSIYMWVRVG